MNEDKKTNIVDEFVSHLPEHIIPYLDTEQVAKMREFVESPVLEVEGFQSEREFCRFISKQIIGMRQDLERGDGDTLLKRIMTCEEGAQQYLLLYGHGGDGAAHGIFAAPGKTRLEALLDDDAS